MNFPLHKLDDITEGLLKLCQGLDFPINANIRTKWRCVSNCGDSGDCSSAAEQKSD